MHNAQFIHDYEFYELFFNNGFRRIRRNIDKHDNS